MSCLPLSSMENDDEETTLKAVLAFLDDVSEEPIENDSPLAYRVHLSSFEQRTNTGQPKSSISPPPSSLAANVPVLRRNDDNGVSVKKSSKASLTPPLTVTEPVITGSARRNVRLRKRDELLYLREQVQALEIQRKSLQALTHQKRDAIANEIENSKNDGGSVDENPACESLWKAIASRQFEERKKSENENKRLRELVEYQKREALALHRAIKRRATAQQMIQNGLGLPRHRGKPWNNIAVLDQLVSEMDELYVRVDNVVLSTILSQPPVVDRTKHLKHDARGNLFLEFAEILIVPFDIRVVERAIMASHDERGLKGTPNLYNKFAEATGDTVMRSCGVIYHQDNIEGDIQIAQVARKYVEETRTVIVSRLVTHPTWKGESPKPKAAFRQTQWRVITRHLVHGSDPTTLIRSNTIITLHDDEGDGHDQLAVCDDDHGFGEKTIAAWDNALTRSNELAENLMMEEVCQRSVVST